MHAIDQPTSNQQITDVIQQYIREQFLYDRSDVTLTPDLPLIEERIIDSIQIFQLVNFLQERFAIEIELEDLLLENFSSLATMTTLVQQYKVRSEEAVNA